MNLREILDTSIVTALFNYVYRRYSKTEQKLIDIYRNSQIYRLIEEFCKKIRICARYSFLGRITKIKQIRIKQISPGALENSRIVQSLINFYKRWKDRIIRYLRASLTIMLAKDAEEQLYSSPVRTTSIIVVTVVVVNVLLTLVLLKPIGLLGWLARGLLLFVGISGLFCQADWPTVKSGSIFLKRMRID